MMAVSYNPYLLFSASYGCLGSSTPHSHRLTTGDRRTCHTLGAVSADPLLPHRVGAVPILSDNYAYLLVDPVTKKTACVDPAEPEKVRVV